MTGNRLRLTVPYNECELLISCCMLSLMPCQRTWTGGFVETPPVGGSRWWPYFYLFLFFPLICARAILNGWFFRWICRICRTQIFLMAFGCFDDGGFCFAWLVLMPIITLAVSLVLE